MSWSLVLKVRDNKIKIVSQTKELPNMNVTLNGHDDVLSNNTTTHIGYPKS